MRPALAKCACIVIENHYHLGMDATSKPSLRTTDAGAEVQPTAVGSTLPCLKSTELFGPTREILIEHGGAYYRLRLTHSNKLILTK
jgi:hemin uptake protein HemP